MWYGSISVLSLSQICTQHSHPLLNGCGRWLLNHSWLIVDSSGCLTFSDAFIFSLTPENLSKFLRFVTGSPICGIQHIDVGFNAATSSFTRQPSANTCASTIHLPTLPFHPFHKSLAVYLTTATCGHSMLCSR